MLQDICSCSCHCFPKLLRKQSAWMLSVSEEQEGEETIVLLEVMTRPQVSVTCPGSSILLLFGRSWQSALICVSNSGQFQSI